MSDISIKVENLGKKYIIRHQQEGRRYKALRDVLTDGVKCLMRGSRAAKDATREEFWALKDVCFEIPQGESVGIIGRNGAGKSTLLKLLSRITEPSTGRIEIKGRISSLLEVGTGFHPELTGRENIFLNGAVLGMSRAEIKRSFDEIVAFAEVEKFLDTPVKRYSSGMYMRLAFSVAAHLEPEILVVDEVLAVGDSEFQKKCLGKMKETAGSGRTVIFVSHNIAAITSLTQKAVFLQGGQCHFYGDTQTAVNRYLTAAISQQDSYQSDPTGDRPQICRVQIFCSDPNSTQESGAPMRVEFDLYHPKPIPKACFSFQIVNQAQVPVLHFCAYDTPLKPCVGSGITTLVCHIPRLNLNVGRYSIYSYFSEPPGGAVYQHLENTCPFEVVMFNKTTLFGWRQEACTYHEQAEWECMSVK